MSSKSNNSLSLAQKIAFEKEIEKSSNDRAALETRVRDSYYEVLDSLKIPEGQKQFIKLTSMAGGLLGHKTFPVPVGDFLGTLTGCGLIVTAELLKMVFQSDKDNSYKSELS